MIGFICGLCLYPIEFHGFPNLVHDNFMFLLIVLVFVRTRLKIMAYFYVFYSINKIINHINNIKKYKTIYFRCDTGIKVVLFTQ